jgi:hypothetical protein
MSSISERVGRDLLRREVINYIYQIESLLLKGEHFGKKHSFEQFQNICDQIEKLDDVIIDQIEDDNIAILEIEESGEFRCLCLKVAFLKYCTLPENCDVSNPKLEELRFIAASLGNIISRSLPDAGLSKTVEEESVEPTFSDLPNPLSENEMKGKKTINSQICSTTKSSPRDRCVMNKLVNWRRLNPISYVFTSNIVDFAKHYPSLNGEQTSFMYVKFFQPMINQLVYFKFFHFRKEPAVKVEFLLTWGERGMN